MGAIGLLTLSTPAPADVSVPSIFGSHMVLQQGKDIVVWGDASPGEAVTVAIAGRKRATTASPEGEWRVRLEPLAVGGPHTMTITGKNTLTLEDVLVGEVWVCSGQSNMAWSVSGADDADLETMTADYPRIRLISVPQVGTQEPQKDFRGEWQVCSPRTVGGFSAVGYFFGQTLHRSLDVPIGLIDNAWGGSAAEAWVRRDVLMADVRYGPLFQRWAETERTYDAEKVRADHERRVAAWTEAAAKARAEGKPVPGRPRAPRNPLTGNHRPANIYCGVLNPIIGLSMRGVIWYQGESNAGRAYQYRHLFPLMIRNWREDWKQGDFPFYWVQLADFMDEKPEPGESAWAELREAQTMTLALPNTGQAVIVDAGEAHDIHPKDKLTVGRRLARWALARDYGKNIVYRSPEYRSMEVKEGKAIVTFDHVGGGLDTFDVRQPRGFAIAGEDRKWVWAQARILDKTRVEVWSEKVPSPVAVRYAWADNPVANLQNREGLPATPFRTDDWPGVTIDRDR